MDWQHKVALFFLSPEMISGLLGRNHVSRKARALVMHDRLLTRYPRDPKRGD